MSEWVTFSEFMPYLGWVAGPSLLLIALVCWWLNLITVPGNWLMVLVAALYAWLLPIDGRAAIGWPTLISLFLLATVGEIVEFFAGAAGAQRAGASRRSIVYSIVGSIGGAILGAIIGVPIPVVGSFIAAILFGGLGATAGALYGEWTDGREWKESWAIGHAAFWGRTLGVLGKLICGGIAVIALLVGLLL
ncbi:MAG: DUF456 domain-containing protein [Planctomycetota bacterium]